MDGNPVTTVLNDVSYERYRATQYFGSLDGLRGLAVLAVIWHHTAGHHFSGTWLATAGPHGVTLFFAISGLLITTLLLREHERHGVISLSRFYLRRTLRIFPLYYGVLTAYAILVWWLETGPRREGFFANLPAFLTYTSNWFVAYDAGPVIFYFAWSLATEEQFYLVWPWVERVCSPGVPLVLMTVVVIATGLIDLLGMKPDLLASGSLAGRIVTSISPAICLGVIGAHLLHERRSFAVVARVAGYAIASPLVLAAFLGLLVLEARELWVHVFATMIVLTCVIREDHALAAVLKVPPLVWLGKVSYGMYLLHMLSYHVSQRAFDLVGIDPGPLVTFASTSLVAVGAATISFQTFEAFFLRIGKRYSR